MATADGPFGAAYGIPFAVEGIFFFLEAIFLAIYIYGWRRLRPWPHLLTGVPVVLAGIGGTASVVAANGWMNLPGGITLRDGRVVDVTPAVYFNRAFWYEALHCCWPPTSWPGSWSPACMRPGCSWAGGTATTGSGS